MNRKNKHYNRGNETKNVPLHFIFRGAGTFFSFGRVSEMTFEQAHDAFIQCHVEKRTGERRGRLNRGHRDAEKLFCQNVWWPLLGNFDGLHPEFEVLDWRGLSYFCDFAWLTGTVKLIIEIKGFGPHVRDMDRQKYCNELNRETFLSALGFQVISFAFDDVAHRPELCITLLRMVISRYQSQSSPVKLSNVLEREIIRLACRLARPLRPIDVEKHLSINHRYAVRMLQSLCSKGWFAAAAGASGQHVVRYELQHNRNIMLHV
jgi:very-short-patch-repair endonuclease